MAPPHADSLGIQAMSPTQSHFSSLSNSKHISSSREEDTVHTHRYVSRVSRRASMVDTSSISNVVYSLTRRSSDELGAGASSKLVNTSHETIMEWIREQRMSHLPPEGSSYDKVLAWAQLFVERLHSFDDAIADFAGDSYIATQLAYGYCSVLLELGKENAAALMISFGFFYNMSVPLVNLLERTELFSVSSEIREQLVSALSDLVTLVASVATHFHKAIRGLTTASISVNIYNTFPSEIKTFADRCERTSESMWRHQLLKEGIDGNKVSSVKSIRNWLLPEDHNLMKAPGSTSHLAHDREELTCLWVAPFLTRFLKSDQQIMSISGKQGSGKTVLSSVIVDYLQQPIGGVSYVSLYVPINSRYPAESSPRAIIKAILSQLFDKRIGNIGLLQILSEAFERAETTSNDSDYDRILWETLNRALSAALPGAKELVIVVDGVDEASCNETDLVQRLSTAAVTGTDVKLITLGSEKPKAAAHHEHVHISEELIFDDIAAVVKGLFQSSKAFVGLPELDQETMVTRIAQASNGSFLWAKLGTKQIRQENNTDKLRKAVDVLISSKLTVSDFVANTVQAPDVSDNAKHMLMWLSTSERPLSLKELSTLVLVQPEKNVILDQLADPLAILKPVNSLVFLQDGMVSIRHGLTRSAILDLHSRNKLVPQVKDRHLDLATRLLFYIKSTVTQEREVTLSGLDVHETSQLVKRYPLLNFAVRHWPVHVRRTTAFVKEGDVSAAKQLSKVFPTSTTVLLLQRTLWERKPAPVALAYQATTTNICRQLLTSKSPVTLQSVVFLATLCRQVGLITESVPLFYEATTMANSFYSKGHTVTMQIASLFLEITESMTVTEKTDIMIKREEMLLVLIECYKTQYGQTSETVISIQNRLVEHYRLIKEEHKAQQIVQSIREITSNDFGEQDSNLHVHLKGRQETQRVEAHTHLQLDVEEHDELISESGSFNFEQHLRIAERYASEGRMDLAEQSYIEVWQRVSREYRSHHSDLWEQRKIRAVLGYSKFLQTQKRETDASSVVSSVWEEYRQSNMVMTESTVSLFQEMSKVMRSLNLSSQSLTLLKRCSQYYQATSRTQSSSYKEIQQSIQTTSQEIMQSVSSSSTVTSESSLHEMILETSTSINNMDQATFQAISTLVRLYTSQHRWQDATRLLKKVLGNIWPSLFSPSVQDVTAPHNHTDSCVELAERLSECYLARRRMQKVENLRVRIYRAVKNCRKVDDKLRDRVTTELICFLRRTSQTEMIITIHQEMLDAYTAHYGQEHPTVIKMLWQLADETRSRPVFVGYYQRIIRVLNKDSPVCHQETFEPTIIVATELWNRGQYTDALPYYKMVFTTFVKQPKLSTKLQDQPFVKELFNRYTHCLRSVRTDFTSLHNVTVEYRSQCKTVFGTHASITVQATLQLARICQESKVYEHEAIAIYEELMHIQSEEIDHHEISAILDSIYEEQADYAMSSKSHSVSSSQRERAFKVLKTRVTTVRETHGWAHAESLSKLTELVRFHSRQQETEIVQSELRETAVNVLSSETSSTRLISAASTIASNYISTNMVHKATELQEEIYRQVIMKDTSNTSSTRFDLSFRGRESLIFLAQFENSLHRNSVATDEILAELTTQYVYYEQFRRATHSKNAKLHDVSVSAARLYQCLVTCGRQTAANRVFEEFTNFFINVEGKKIGLTKSSQTTILLETILQHFSTHTSQDFVRSVGISSIDRVAKLLKAQKYETACDLALACFTYISSQREYRTPIISKLVLILGMTVAGRDLTSQPDAVCRKKMLEASGTIVPDVLHVLGELKISLEEVSVVHLNSLIGLLGDQRDYRTLSWLLTILWNSREAQRNWHPSITMALGRRFIMAKYLVGDSMAAVRLAEDIVYNCRRVHGSRHSSTIEMSTFLSQLYTSIAQRYQGQKDGRDMANRYYKKSAAVHENILRVFSDPAYADMDANSSREFGLSHDGGVSPYLGSLGRRNSAADAQYVRQHMHLLKLSVQRLGGWPKDYGEYQRLNADVFRAFGADLKGVSGMEKWNLSGFEPGRAEGDDDLLDADFKDWEFEYAKLSPKGESPTLSGTQSFIPSLPLVQN